MRPTVRRKGNEATASKSQESVRSVKVCDTKQSHDGSPESNRHQKCLTGPSINIVSNDEPGTRKSGRKRIMNSRYQDMEVEITPKRLNLKCSPKDRKHETSTPLKEENSSQSEKRSGKKRGADLWLNRPKRKKQDATHTRLVTAVSIEMVNDHSTQPNTCTSSSTVNLNVLEKSDTDDRRLGESEVLVSHNEEHTSTEVSKDQQIQAHVKETHHKVHSNKLENSEAQDKAVSETNTECISPKTVPVCEVWKNSPLKLSPVIAVELDSPQPDGSVAFKVLSPVETDTAPSHADDESVVFMDLDTGEQKQIINTKPQSLSKSSTSDSKTHTEHEKDGKHEVEDDMLNLFNLFMQNSDQKKDDFNGIEAERDSTDNNGGPIKASDVSTGFDDMGVVSTTMAESNQSTEENSNPNPLIVSVNDQWILLKTEQQLPASETQQTSCDVSTQQLPEPAKTKSEIVLAAHPQMKKSVMNQIHFVVSTPPNSVQPVQETVKLDQFLPIPKTRRKDDFLQMSEDGSLYCCTECSYKTEKKVNWYKHKLKHKPRRYPCHNCSYMASTSSNLKRHLLSHSDIKEYACHLCDDKFRQKIHLTRHIKYKHEERQIQCTYCDYVCAHIQPELIHHIKRKHSDICSLDEDGNIQGDQGPLDLLMKFKCDYCNVYTISRKDLQQHMKFHKKGGELKFFCESCSFVTECESRLKRHVLTHTKEKPFKCSMCEYRASEAEHVRRHLRSKHKVNVISANKRTRRTPKTEMEDNIEASAFLDGSLTRKKKYPMSDTRHCEKHFACNFCSMKFTKLINLFKHVHGQHKHLLPQDSIYNCVVCDFCTGNYKRLLLHMRKMHSTTNLMNTPQKQVYVCMFCNYSSPYRLYLHAHLKKEHNMQLIADKEGVNKYMLDASKHSSMLVQTSEEAEAKKPGSIIKQSGSISQSDLPSNISKDSKMVLLQLTPDGPMTPVIINMGDNNDVASSTSSLLHGTDADTEYSIMETGITDGHHLGIDEDHDLDQVLQEVSAATSTTMSRDKLDTLEQVDLPQSTSLSSPQPPPSPSAECIITSLVPVTHEGEAVTPVDNNQKPEVCHVNEVGLGNTTKPVPDGFHPREILDSVSVITDEDSAGEPVEEVVQLTCGDFVEINGQIYKIEMEEEEIENS